MRASSEHRPRIPNALVHRSRHPRRDPGGVGGLISPQNTKLSNLQAQETQLQTQQTRSRPSWPSLRTEQQRLSSSCADLQKISTQIPSVQSPTDIDAEESSFESQFNGARPPPRGSRLTQFSGFAPATSTSGTTASPATTTPSASGGSASPVPRVQPVSRLCRPRWRSPGRTVRCWRSSMASTTSPDCSSSRSSSCPFGATIGDERIGGSRPQLGRKLRLEHGLRPGTRSRPLWIGGTPTRDGRSVQSGHHRVDLLHLDAQRA